ncbi:YeaH/YhbH family protein [Klebsiella variicola subsp. variicola]|nr:YeaH/YhbH family protein [Klebsiella variicola subsp. variicola]
MQYRRAYDLVHRPTPEREKKSAVNRQRFLRRYKAQIKQSISEAINKRSVTDIESGESVSIPTDDINEPMFHQGRGGLRNRVHPGNDHFVQNDRIERPQVVAAAVAAVRGKPAPTAKGRMSLSSRFRKMSTWICYLKISPCRT